MSSSIKLKNANGKIVSVTNSNANQTDKEIIYLNTVDELANASGSINAVAIVSDLSRGGTFVWSATGTANGGTVFAGATGYWNRQYSGAVNVKWFGAIGDGITDDTISFALLDSFLTSRNSTLNSLDLAEINTVLLKDGIFKSDHVPTSYINFVFDNARIESVSGVPSNSYTNDFKRYIAGSEYSWWWLKACMDTEQSAVKKILFSGDSTTFGVNSPSKSIDILFAEMANNLGVSNVTTVNVGHSGGQTLEWDTLGWVDADISAHPNMSAYVARWGLNDGTCHDKAIFETHLRAGLTRLRAFKGVGELTIVLMTPNTSNQTNKQYDWIESIIPIIKKASIDFKCVYIDTYALFPDSTTGNGLWNDNIHPDSIMTNLITNLVADVLLKPVSLYSPNKTNTFANIPGAQQLLSVSKTTGFKYGTTFNRTSGFPIDGFVKTEYFADGVIKQTNIGYTNDLTKRSITRYMFDSEGVWSDWRGLDYNLSPINGWVNAGTEYPLYTKDDSNIVHIEAYLKNGALLTEFFILPVGYRPHSNQRFLSLGNTGTVGYFQVGSDGSVIPITGDVAGMYINCSFLAY